MFNFGVCGSIALGNIFWHMWSELASRTREKWDRQASFRAAAAIVVHHSSTSISSSQPPALAPLQNIKAHLATRPMANEVYTFRTLVLSFTDFLTVAIHTILYERGIYPQTSFLSARKYNVAVRQNRHPKVCQWINDAVSAVEAELLKGAVERVVVMLYTRLGKAVERYVFDVSRFPAVLPADVDMPLERIGPSGDRLAVVPGVDMDEQFRATMSKLANCGSRLTKLTEDCTFTVAIELKSDGGRSPIGHPQPWMPVQAKDQRTASVDAHGRTTIPVRSVAAGEMIFESWIEEAF